jgi:uncharacterized protein YkwD
VKTLLLFLIFISCSNVDQLQYVPKEVVATDTLTYLINSARLENNLTVLKPEILLIELSKKKVLEMESNEEVNHYGFSSLPIKTETFAQIIGYGYKSETNLFNSYMTSGSHQDKILGNFTHIGSYTHNTYNCVLFAKY